MVGTFFSSAAKGGFRAGRFAAYTLTTTGLALGGAIAYANYDPMFKKQADDIIPGFARLADTVADLFVDRVGSTRPQQGTGTTGKSRAGVGREKVGEVRRPRERKESVVDGGNRVEGEVVTNQQSDPKDEAQTKEEAVPMKDNEEVYILAVNVLCLLYNYAGHANSLSGTSGCSRAREHSVIGGAREWGGWDGGRG